jgi:predicted nucleotidyltransferase
METLGETIRKLREEKQIPLRVVAESLDIDQAVVSKIERGVRKATRQQVIKFAGFYSIPENNLLITWLADQILYEISDEEIGLDALKVAEEKLAYQVFKKIDRSSIIEKITTILRKFPSIGKAWIFGSFARKDENFRSDIDLAVKSDSSFSYFDLAEVQHLIELEINRKVDIGFIDSFKPHIIEHIRPDLELIYEKG